MNKKMVGFYKLNSISNASNILLSIITAVFSISCIIPFILIISVSLTDERSIALKGFQFIPGMFSTEAYKYIFSYSYSIINSYGISIFVTVMGTFICLLFCSMYAYSLSRSSFLLRGVFSFIVVFTMLYNGGLVSFYIICTKLLHLQENILALILPYAVSGFNILVLRTYFKTNIHESIIEAAKIDGASEYGIFFRIIIRISLPGLATIALLSSITYWNDWMLAMLFINKPSLFPLQYLLMRLENAVQVLQSVASTPGGGYSANQLDITPAETARMAMVVISVGPIALAYPFFQKYFIKGLTLGAVKG